MKLLLSITLASVYGISLRLLFASFGDNMVIMSLSFFFIVPFGIGYLTILLLPYKEHHTSAGAFFKPWITCAVILFITCLFKLEGMICWVMAFPIFAIIAGFGGLLAFRRKRRRAQKEIEWDFDKPNNKPTTLNISLLLFIPLLLGVVEGKRLASDQDLVIEKQIEIRAPAEAVWRALTAAHYKNTNPHHTSLCNMLGFPRHISTTLDTLAIGKQRIATYEKGLTFTENISRLDPDRCMELNITTDATTISKAIMDEHIVIGGEHIQMQKDIYTLQPLARNLTRLVLTSHFRINTPFNWYAGIWANWLMSEVLKEELQSLQTATKQ